MPNRIEAGRARACRSPSDHVGKSVLLPRTRKPASECRNADKTVVNNLDNLKLYHKIKWDLKSPYEERVNYSNQQGSANRKGEKGRSQWNGTCDTQNNMQLIIASQRQVCHKVGDRRERAIQGDAEVLTLITHTRHEV